MSSYPEKAATAIKVGTAVAVGAGSLALAGSAQPRLAEKFIPKKLERNEFELDRYAHLAMMSSTVEVILAEEKKPVKKLHIPHNSEHHTSTLFREGPHLKKWLYELGYCESRDNYSKNTGNGFLGKYQFEQVEWNSVAKKTGHNNLVGLPVNEATPDEQDMMIVLNTDMASDGLASQNPGCFESMHLSEFPPKD